MRQIATRDHELERVKHENAALVKRLQSMDTGTGAASPAAVPSASDASPGHSGGGEPSHEAGGAAPGQQHHATDDSQATGEGGGATDADAAGRQQPGSLLRRHNRELLRDLALCRRELGALWATECCACSGRLDVFTS